MKKIVISLLLVLTIFTMTGCNSRNEKEEVNGYELEITNMSQLPFDMVNLKGTENKETTVLFLSTNNETSNKNFEAELDGLSLISKEGYYYVGMNQNNAYVYENKDLNTSLTKTYIDGGMQILYEMKDNDSPKEFQLDIVISNGSRIEKTELGEYVIYDKNGDIEFLLGQAWAVDSNGEFISSYYEIQDNSIKQVIDYDGTNYPVKADPLFCRNTVDNGKTTWDSSYGGGQGTLAVYPTTCAKVYLAAMVLFPGTLLFVNPLLLIESSSVVADMYDELQGDYSYSTHVLSWQEGRIADQFSCHAFNPVVQLLQKYPWNLEPWRPDVSLAQTFLDRCNPPVS